MSTNVDISSPNSNLPCVNKTSDSTSAVELVVDELTGKGVAESSNQQQMENPESESATPPNDSQSPDVEGNVNTSTSGQQQSGGTNEDSNRNCPVIEYGTGGQDNENQHSHPAESSCSGNLGQDHSENSSSQARQQQGATENASGDSSSLASSSTGAELPEQNSTTSQTPDSVPDITESKSSNLTTTSPSDISFSSQSAGNVQPSSEQSAMDVSNDDSACASACAAEAKPNSSSVTDDAPLQSIYHIKWIKFRDESCPIITQNENGPCPLIAIMNVLLLQQKVKFPPMMEMVTSSQLMDYLGDCILEYAPKNMTEASLLNYEQNMHDAMAVFHKLQTGLDVNVKFTGVDTFEYTSECIVFDLLEIHLYHGWLVDPENTMEVSALGNNSYNQLVEMIIRQKQSPREELVTEALLAEEFLNRSSHQLTYHGLSELASTVKENELCVFFRNNHFSTLLKQKNELFLLVTDQGFLTESSVVWETLSNVEGDGHFVDAFFHTFCKAEPSTHNIPPSSVTEGSTMQIDQDYLVALSLQQEQQQCETQNVGPDWTAPLSDHELAVKLQEEENRRANAAMQRQQPQGHNPQGGGGHAQPSNPPHHRQNQSRTNRENPRDQTKKKDNSTCVIV